MSEVCVSPRVQVREPTCRSGECPDSLGSAASLLASCGMSAGQTPTCHPKLGSLLATLGGGDSPAEWVGPLCWLPHTHDLLGSFPRSPVGSPRTCTGSTHFPEGKAEKQSKGVGTIPSSTSVFLFFRVVPSPPGVWHHCSPGR